jgi:prevent-host-death family protein
MEVGVRELKAKLSEYLRRAGDGESVVVTDRGRPVARIVSYDTGSSTVQRGVDEGWIEPARRTQFESGPRFHSSRTVIDVLDEDRG